MAMAVACRSHAELVASFHASELSLPCFTEPAVGSQPQLARQLRGRQAVQREQVRLTCTPCPQTRTRAHTHTRAHVIGAACLRVSFVLSMLASNGQLLACMLSATRHEACLLSMPLWQCMQSMLHLRYEHRSKRIGAVLGDMIYALVHQASLSLSLTITASGLG